MNKKLVQSLAEIIQSLTTEEQELLEDTIKNKLKPELSYQPKTELGKKLWQIRSQAIAEGKIKLLDWDGIEKEIAQRRGETE